MINPMGGNLDEKLAVCLLMLALLAGCAAKTAGAEHARKKWRAIFPGEKGPSGWLFELERAGIELVVGAPLGDQILVRAALDDAAVVEHQNRVAVLHR